MFQARARARSRARAMAELSLSPHTRRAGARRCCRGRGRPRARGTRASRRTRSATSSATATARSSRTSWRATGRRARGGGARASLRASSRPDPPSRGRLAVADRWVSENMEAFSGRGRPANRRARGAARALPAAVASAALAHAAAPGLAVPLQPEAADAIIHGDRGRRTPSAAREAWGARRRRRRPRTTGPSRRPPSPRTRRAGRRRARRRAAAPRTGPAPGRIIERARCPTQICARVRMRARARARARGSVSRARWAARRHCKPVFHNFGRENLCPTVGVGYGGTFTCDNIRRARLKQAAHGRSSRTPGARRGAAGPAANAPDLAINLAVQRRVPPGVEDQAEPGPARAWWWWSPLPSPRLSNAARGPSARPTPFRRPLRRPRRRMSRGAWRAQLAVESPPHRGTAARRPRRSCATSSGRRRAALRRPPATIATSSSSARARARPAPSRANRCRGPPLRRPTPRSRSTRKSTTTASPTRTTRSSCRRPA